MTKEKSKKPTPLPPDPDDMNDDRAMWANECLETMRSMSGCERGQEALGDLLCNLFHWGDRHGFTPDEIENIFSHAREMYRQETMPLPEDEQ